MKTDIPMPTLEIDRELKTEFLGYDYAYENGDNYSAVYNEMPHIFPEFELNQNGLFQTKKETLRPHTGTKGILPRYHPNSMLAHRTLSL